MADTKDQNPTSFATAMESSKQQKTVTIDGVTYQVADLSEDARMQIVNLRAVDQEISRLNRMLAIAQTARNTYAKALSEALPNAESSNSVQ